MNVPRGTPARVFEIALPKWQQRALRDGNLTRARIPMLAANSKVHPGTFKGLDLESGRLVRGAPDQVRARHRFASGNTRVVTVMPAFTPGDLLWVHNGTGKRARSEYTLRVRRVHAARLQDLDWHATGLGVESVPVAWQRGAKRQWFRHVWDTWRLVGRRAWGFNQWCWVVEFEAIRANVDKLLEREGA